MDSDDRRKRNCSANQTLIDFIATVIPELDIAKIGPVERVG
jgi:hypothetical protein